MNYANKHEMEVIYAQLKPIIFCFTTNCACKIKEKVIIDGQELVYSGQDKNELLM